MRDPLHRLYDALLFIYNNDECTKSQLAKKGYLAAANVLPIRGLVEITQPDKSEEKTYHITDKGKATVEQVRNLMEVLFEVNPERKKYQDPHGK